MSDGFRRHVPSKPMPNAQTAAQGLEPLSEPLSPELVLVDPSLAAAARARLPDRPRFSPTRHPSKILIEELVAAGSCRPIAAAADSSPPAQPERWPERAPRRARSGLTGAAALAGAGIVLALGIPTLGPKPVLVRAEDQPVSADPDSSDAFAAPPRAPQTQEPKAPLTSAGPTVLKRRPAPAPPRTSQTFVWPRAKGASSYEFQLFRGSTLVFRARTAKARLTLPTTWKHAGRVRRLSPGPYRWYVWPIRAGKKEPAAAALVQARIVIPKESEPSDGG